MSRRALRHARRWGSALLLVLTPAGARAQAATLVARGAWGTVDLGMPTLATRAPDASPALLGGLAWRPIQPGLQVATIDLRAGSYGISLEAVVVRVEPATVRFSLQYRVTENGMTGTWTVDSAGPGAVLAMNAGQFKETGPWGWLVVDGEERRTPGRAPLAVGIRIDSAGRLRWVTDTRHVPHEDRATSYAFQSFPVLFLDRRIPRALRDPALTNLAHRDTRLVLAERDDGALLFILTRYEALGAVAERVPIGLTTPETVALAAALGARHAVMLDGGGSAQLLVRDTSGAETAWRGLRRVPLGLVAEPRRPH